MAGLARVGDLRRRSAESVRLRADRARRRPHGGANPRARGPAPGRAHMQVSVIAPPYEQWPLPWYLRTMPIVGYWTGPGIRWRCRRRSSSRPWSTRLRSMPRSAIATCRSSSASARGAPDALRRARVCGIASSRQQASAPALPRAGVAGTRCGTVATRAHRDAPRLALVVPCHNEAARLGPEAFLQFVSTHPGVHLVMVDDGSADGTGESSSAMRRRAPAAVTVAAALPAPRQGRGRARRHPRRARAARGAGRVLRRGPVDPARARSTTSWPFSACARTSSSSSAPA